MKYLSILALVVVSLSSFKPGAKDTNFDGTIKYSMKVLGENADEMAAFMPEGLTLSIMKDNMYMKMDGGFSSMMPEVLFLGKEMKGYSIMHSEKVAYLTPEPPEDEDKMQPKVEEEEEVIVICGYKCKKYKVIAEVNGMETVQYVWITDQIITKKSKKMKANVASGLMYEGIEGFALKTMTSDPTSGVTMIMTAESVVKGDVDKELFKVPDGYEIKDMPKE